MQLVFLLMIALVMLLTACPNKPVEEAKKDDAAVTEKVEAADAGAKDEAPADAGTPAKADAGAEKGKSDEAPRDDEAKKAE